MLEEAVALPEAVACEAVRLVPEPRFTLAEAALNARHRV